VIPYRYTMYIYQHIETNRKTLHSRVV